MSIVTAFSFEEVYVEIPTNVNRLVSRAQPFIGVIQIYQEPLRPCDFTTYHTVLLPWNTRGSVPYNAPPCGIQIAFFHG